MSSPGDPASPPPADQDGGDEHHDAFISYSHVDAAFADALRVALEARGVDVWIDEADIPSGSRWREELERAIENSDAFVFLLGPESAISQHCRQELGHAVELNKRILPVRVRETPDKQVPDSLAAYQFIPSRGIFGDSFDACVGRLVAAIQTDLDWVREHTAWGLKGREWDRGERDPSFLLSGTELELAERWRSGAVGKEPGVSRLQSEYIDASRQAATRRLRRTRGFVSGALVVAIALAVLALIQRQQAVSEKQSATSGEIAAQSLLQLGTDPQLSLLLADESAQTKQTPAALDALRRSLPANHLLQTFHANDRPLIAAAWTPDGSRVMTAGLDGYARIWSVATGRVLRTFRTSDYYTQGAAFDARADHLMTWAPGAVDVYDLSGATAPVTIVDDSFGKLQDAAISPDGRFVATASTGGFGAVLLFDAVTGRKLHTLATVDQRLLGANLGTSVDFSPDSGFVASGSEDGTATVWNVASGQVSRPLTVAAHPSTATGTAYVFEASFSPDGTRLLTTTGLPPEQSPGTMLPVQTQVWDLDTGRQLSYENGSEASWSPGSGYVANTSSDGTARVWVAGTGRQVSQLKLPGSFPITGQAKWAPDVVDPVTHLKDQVSHIVTGSQNGAAAIWNAISGTQMETLAGDFGGIEPAGFSTDGNRVLTFSGDGSARIWDTGGVVAQPAFEPHVLAAAAAGGPGSLGPAFGLSADPLAPLLAVPVGYTGALRVLDARTGAQLAVLPAIPHGSWDAAAFDRSGRVLLAMSVGAVSARPAELHLAHGGRLLHTLSGPGSLAGGGALSPDGSIAAAVDNRNRIGVWDVASGRELTVFTGHVGRHNPYGPANVALKFSPDGTLILSADESGLSFVWDARTGHVLNRIQGTPEPTGMYAGMGGAISPDDRFVVTTASWDHEAHVYRVGGSDTALLTLRGHAAGINDAEFGPDSTLLATISTADDTVRVWDTLHGDPLLTIPESYIGSRVDFSPDGQSILTDGATPYETLPCIVCGGFGRLLTLAHNHETRQLTPEERSLYLSG
jgi:WD40 repeat protein